MCYIWIISFFSLGLAHLLCVHIVIIMIKLYSIFSAIATKLKTEIKLYFVNNIMLIALCPQISILGYTNTDDRCFITKNLILLIFKFYVYKSRVSGSLSFSAFFHKFAKIENLEKGAAVRNQRKLDIYKKKSPFIENALHSE